MHSRRLWHSLLDAVRGVLFVYKNEQNFRIQAWAAFAVIIAMMIFSVRKEEMIILLLLIVSVLTLELLNSAMERFVDIIKPRLHLHVGVIKDILAAMVLLVSFGAAVIGGMIFWPYILALIPFD